jgi:hypothetical protein
VRARGINTRRKRGYRWSNVTRRRNANRSTKFKDPELRDV